MITFLVTSLISGVILTIGFVLGIWAPLKITDILYQIYNILGSWNFGALIKNQIVAYYLFIALIIGILGISIILGLKALSLYWQRKKQSYDFFVGRLIYGTMGIIFAPLALSVLISLSSFIFRVLNPLEFDKRSFSQLQLLSLKNLLKLNSDQIKEILANGKIDGKPILESLKSLQNALQTIINEAKASGGNDELLQQANIVLTQVNNLLLKIDGKFIDDFQKVLNKILEEIIQNKSLNWEIFEKQYDEFLNFSSNLTNFFDGLKSLFHQFGNSEISSKDWINIKNFINNVENDINWKNSFGHIFLSQPDSISLISELLNENDGANLNKLFFVYNKRPSFLMIIMIYQFVTGHLDYNWDRPWMWSGQAIKSLNPLMWSKLIIAIFALQFVLSGMLSYTVYIISRICWIILALIFSIIYSFSIDNGQKWKTLIEQIIARAFDIIFIQLGFTLIVSLLGLNIWKEMLKTNNLGQEIFLVISCILFGISFGILDNFIGMLLGESSTMAKSMNNFSTIWQKGSGITNKNKEVGARAQGIKTNVGNVSRKIGSWRKARKGLRK